MNSPTLVAAAAAFTLGLAQAHALTLAYHLDFDGPTDNPGAGAPNGVNLANSGSFGNTYVSTPSTTGYTNYTTVLADTWGGSGRSFANNGGTFKFTNEGATGIGISFDTGFTIGMQVYRYGNTAWKNPFSLRIGSDALRLERDASSKLQVYTNSSSIFSSYGNQSTGINYPMDQWIHIALSYENVGGNGVMKFWENGVNSATITGTALTGYLNEFWIGAGSNGKENTRFDDVAVFDGVLNAAQMQQMAAGASSVVIPESSTYALGAGLLMGLVGLVRRRRQ